MGLRTSTERPSVLRMDPYPVSLSIEYPDRPLNRLTTFFRMFVAIPILIVLGSGLRRRGLGMEQ